MKKNTVRRLIAKSAYLGKASHIGSALSIVEILEAIYFRVANISKDNVNDESRDRVILSKGHGSLALYCTLAEKGIIPKHYLSKYLVNGGILPCHIDMNSAPGLEASTGSLGHGLGIGEGLALANRIKGINARIFVIVGDGEFQEGSVLEALNSICALNLNEISIIVDCNGFQASAATWEVMDLDTIKNIFNALNFKTVVVDGHNVDEIETALKTKTNRPIAVIANTVKGKGFSVMENMLESHYIKIDDKMLSLILNELGE